MNPMRRTLAYAGAEIEGWIQKERGGLEPAPMGRLR